MILIHGRIRRDLLRNSWLGRNIFLNFSTSTPLSPREERQSSYKVFTLLNCWFDVFEDNFQFVDKTTITVKGGRGGNGCVSFEMVKYGTSLSCVVCLLINSWSLLQSQ